MALPVKLFSSQPWSNRAVVEVEQMAQEQRLAQQGLPIGGPRTFFAPQSALPAVATFGPRNAEEFIAAPGIVARLCGR